MKVALFVEVAGAPNTLASTAFAGALAEGLIEAGHEVKVFGLATTSASWIPETLGPCASIAPWLTPRPARLHDRFEAVRRGVFDEQGCCADGVRCETYDWYRELLLDRELRAFADDDPEGVVMFYPRSYPALVTVARVAQRMGWKVLSFATEALSDNQIDPATRDDYIRCAACCSDGLWAFSTYLGEFWSDRGVSGDRIIVLPSVIRPSSLAHVPAMPTHRLAVYTGNLAHREADYLIDIAGIVSVRVPEFRLHIYGDASEARREEVEKRIADRGLQDVVSLKPPVSPVDVPAVLARADILLLPRSHGEFSMAGFPNKLGEYLASGRPVVVTGVGDVPRYLTHGQEALIVAPDDSAAFAESVVTLLEDPAVGDRLGAVGRAYADRNLRADRVAARVLSFMSELPRVRPNRVNRGIRIRSWIRAIRGTLGIEQLKRLAVRILRALGLKPPAPDSERVG
jgi:glycosyltransferase involved in cell wall biosynthesis